MMENEEKVLIKEDGKWVEGWLDEYTCEDLFPGERLVFMEGGKRFVHKSKIFPFIPNNKQRFKIK